MRHLPDQQPQQVSAIRTKNNQHLLSYENVPWSGEYDRILGPSSDFVEEAQSGEGLVVCISQKKASCSAPRPKVKTFDRRPVRRAVQAPGELGDTVNFGQLELGLEGHLSQVQAPRDSRLIGCWNLLLRVKAWRPPQAGRERQSSVRTLRRCMRYISIHFLLVIHFYCRLEGWKRREWDALPIIQRRSISLICSGPLTAFLIIAVPLAGNFTFPRADVKSIQHDSSEVNVETTGASIAINFAMMMSSIENCGFDHSTELMGKWKIYLDQAHDKNKIEKAQNAFIKTKSLYDESYKESGYKKRSCEFAILKHANDIDINAISNLFDQNPLDNLP